MGALAGLLVFALVSLRPDVSDRALPPGPIATPPFLAGPGAPDAPSPTTTAATPRATLNSPRRPSPSLPLPLSPSPSPAATPSRSRTVEPPARRPPAADLTGRYRTVQTFEGGFFGEVLVTNSSATRRTWTVRLHFPSTIGPMRTFWVESAPQATLKQEGDVFAFTGSAPVEPGASVAFRFQFDRKTSVTTPLTCDVNGTACTP
ncbi:cellulose binding domain-containing protein [Phytohabitans flavus]|uniref:cellulose binding domain-containing protein n=1 Tax=Phytohabitans flavus TaxID=1076124 RepID=UPI00363D85FA